MKDILVFGKNGRLGKKILAAFEDRAVGLGKGDIDLRRAGLIYPAMLEHKPRFVINCSAMNGLEQCASYPADAIALNAGAVSAMAQYCKEIGAMLIHFSTDYVFPGGALEDYTELSIPNPQSVYGLSKLMGEWAIRQINPYHCIFRLSSLYSDDLAGSLDVLRQAREGQGSPENPIKVLAQLASPISARKVVEFLKHAFATKLDLGNFRGVTGTYHIAPTHRIWKSDFARYTLSRFYPELGALTVVEGKLAEPRPIFMGLDPTRTMNFFEFSIDLPKDLEEEAAAWHSRQPKTAGNA